MTEKILAYIEGYLLSVGYPPTFQEIAEGCNISSKSTVSYYLDKLVGEGKITKKPGIPRSICVIVPM